MSQFGVVGLNRHASRGNPDDTEVKDLYHDLFLSGVKRRKQGL